MQHVHPYISAMVNNGTQSYDHDADGTHTQLAGCSAKFRNVKHDTFVAIRYENDELTGENYSSVNGERKMPLYLRIIKLETVRSCVESYSAGLSYRHCFRLEDLCSPFLDVLSIATANVELRQ